MIKYFIESPDGRWLTEPDSMKGWLTDNPFKAWAFDEIRREDANWVKFARLMEGRFFWGDKFDGSHIEASYAEIVLSQEEGCLEGFKITRQEFVNDGDNLVHRRKIYGSTGTIDQYEKGPIVKNYGNTKEVYLPAWDGPLENFFKKPESIPLEACQMFFIDLSK